MDLICTVCHEPFDVESLHDVADEHDGFQNAYRIFRTLGCGKAFASWGVRCVPDPDTDMTAELAELYALLGDDVDGAAAMIEDLGL